MNAVAPDTMARARRVDLMIFDVDGVLTDGRLWYGPNGEAFKSFHTLDGHGLKMLQSAGVRVAILSGRKSGAVELRSRELGIEHVLQGIDEKAPAFERLLVDLALAPEAAGYMGDDVIDLPVLRRCGFACAPAEALELVRTHAHYTTQRPAGFGAVREVCELLLQARGALEPALARYLAD